MGGDNSIFNLITVCRPCHMFMHCNPQIIMKEKYSLSSKIKKSLELVRVNGKKLGRPHGAKDKEKRDNTGYILRWKNE